MAHPAQAAQVGDVELSFAKDCRLGLDRGVENFADDGELRGLNEVIFANAEFALGDFLANLFESLIGPAGHLGVFAFGGLIERNVSRRAHRH